MNKYFGNKTGFKSIREDATRIVISYDKEDIDDIHCTWFEVFFNKKSTPNPGIDLIKDLIISDVNRQIDEKILTGFSWNNMPVWLSTENQFNYKAAYDLAIQTNGVNLPIKFKLGEGENGEIIYYTFTNMAEFTDFYTKAISFINNTLNEGWQRKDNIDWSLYSK